MGHIQRYPLLGRVSKGPPLKNQHAIGLPCPYVENAEKKSKKIGLLVLIVHDQLARQHQNNQTIKRFSPILISIRFDPQTEKAR